MAQDDQVKLWTDRIEETSNHLKAAAANIASLLNSGVATKAEIDTYNAWAQAMYNVQVGMLDQARAAGVTTDSYGRDLPVLPPKPLVFQWKGDGLSGISLGKMPRNFKDLSKMMKRTLRGPLSDGTEYVSLNEVNVVPAEVDDNSLGFDVLTSGNGNLGIWPLIIAGIALLAVTTLVVAITHYLEVRKIQEETTARMVEQSKAFAIFTQARMECQSRCVSGGNSQAGCVSVCAKEITPPQFDSSLTSSASSLGFWGTVGLAAAGIAVGIGGVHWWRAGRPLPNFHFLQAGNHADADE